MARATIAMATVIGTVLVTATVMARVTTGTVIAMVVITRAARTKVTVVVGLYQ